MRTSALLLIGLFGFLAPQALAQSADEREKTTSEGPPHATVNPPIGDKYNQKGLANSSGESSETQSALGRSDRRFVTRLIEETSLELKIVKLAAERAADPALRQIATTRVDELGKVEQELVKFAERKQVGLPKAGSERALSRLSRARPDKFDREFAEQQREYLEETLDSLKSMARDADDAEVRALAARLVKPFQAGFDAVTGWERRGKERK